MAVLVNVIEVWQNCIDDAIVSNEDYLDFSVMSMEEFKKECINYITFYFDNDMISLEPNYNDIVIDTAKSYEMWEG